ncbi:MAG: hypothetical protein ABI946_11695, partial [Chthoniobacterales bacterium]
RVQIGVRLMLPLLVCLAVGAAAAFVQVHRSLGKRSRIILVACLIVGLLGNAAAAIRVWPEALCYTNPAWGGTRGGYRLLSDSNYDWGQGLLELEQWRLQHGVETIDLWYFGLDPRADQPPFRRIQPHSPDWLGGRAIAEVTSGKCCAVSTTMLFGAYAKNSEPGRASVAFFLAHAPTDRTATYFIYDFRGEKR